MPFALTPVFLDGLNRLFVWVVRTIKEVKANNAAAAVFTDAEMIDVAGMTFDGIVTNGEALIEKYKAAGA